MALTRLKLAHTEVDLVLGRVGDGLLNPRERALLRYLAEHSGRPVPRAELLEAVWSYRGKAATRVVDMTVRRVRTKIERDPSRPRHLLTQRGEGYRLVLPAPEVPRPEDLDEGVLAETTWAALTPEDRRQLAALSVFESPFTRTEARRLDEEPDSAWLIEDGALLRLPRALRARAVQDCPEHVRRKHALWATRVPERIPELIGATRWALGSGERALAEAGCATLGALPQAPAEALLLRARLARSRGALDHARTLSEDAVERARRSSNPRVQAEALRGLAWQANLVGELERGVALHRQAEQPARATGDPLLLGRVQSDLGCALIELGRLAEARTLIESAGAEVRLGGSPRAAVADLHASLGLLALWEEDPDAAIRHHSALLELYGDEPLGYAWALNNLGESHRIAGSLDDARRLFQRSEEWFRAHRGAQALVPRANLALLDLFASRPDRARPVLTEVLADAKGRKARLGRTCILLTACGEDRLDEGRRLLEQTGFCEPVIARVAEHAGLWGLALDQWRRLGRPEEAARVRSV